MTKQCYSINESHAGCSAGSFARFQVQLSIVAVPLEDEI